MVLDKSTSFSRLISRGMSIQLWERPAKRTCFSCICFVTVMSLENPGACGDSSSTGDINRNIRELLLEVRNQRSEINSLKEEVRGASQSVASEVKKIKSGNDIRWRFEGNRLQFEFNSEVADNLKQTLWGLENGKQEYAVEVLKESCDKLKTRNKHIRIADSSEGGWETVRQYISNPLASDSEDETRLSRAESRAVKKKKTQQKPKPKSKASAAYGYTDSLNQHLFLPRSQSQTVGPRIGSFRGYQADQRSTFNVGPCFACGEPNHIHRTCPYTKGAVQQQSDAIVKK